MDVYYSQNVFWQEKLFVFFQWNLTLTQNHAWNLQSITQMMGVGVLNRYAADFGSTTSSTEQLDQERLSSLGWTSAGLVQNLVAFIPNLPAALAILLVGFTLRRSRCAGNPQSHYSDNRIAAMLMGRADSRDLPQVENLTQRGLWIIVLFYHSGCLQTLQLEADLDRWVVFSIRFLASYQCGCVIL